MSEETRVILSGIWYTLRSEGEYMRRHDIPWRDFSLARAEVFALIELLNDVVKEKR